MEKVHKTVLKYIQGLHIRTHDEITRGLLGWSTIKGYIDKAKLSFFRQLAVTPPTSLVKKIFRRQLDDVLLFNKGIGSITYDLISTLREYQLAEYIVYYVTDDSIPCKLAWKSFICDSLGVHHCRPHHSALTIRPKCICTNLYTSRIISWEKGMESNY